MTATGQLEANKQLVLDFFREVIAAQVFGRQEPLDPKTARLLSPVFIVAEDDLVTACFYLPQPEPDDPGETYDYFLFDTYRVHGGKIVESRPNSHKYVPLHQPRDAAVGRGRATQPGHVGSADIEANKQLVRDFYARVFGAMDSGAVRGFVAEDYYQHSSHMPQGRSGLEEFVRAIAGSAPPTTRPAPAAPLPEPDVLVAEGDIVVIAACLPQPEPDGSGTSWPYYAYDAYRVRDGKLAEHWSGINKAAPPQHG